MKEEARETSRDREARKEEIARDLKKLVLIEPLEIVTHRFCHDDELEAIRLLRKELPNRFPGIDIMKVPVILIDNNNAPYNGKTGCENLAEGIYVIGCGGPGPFNHHPHDEFPDFCSCDQVAVALGVEDKPEYRLHLKRVRQNDLAGGGPYAVFAEYLKFKPVRTPEEFEEAYAWIGGYVEPLFQVQAALFAEEMEADFAKTAECWTFKRGDTEIPVCTINNSEQNDIVRFAQIKTVAEIIIKRDKTGNVQIFTYPSRKNLEKKDYRKRVGLQATLAMLRHMEQRAMGLKEINESWDDLTQEGFLFGWYNLKGQTALNGSNTTVVNPTLIPLARIEEAVVLGNRFRPGQFPWEEWLERVGRKDLAEPMF